MKKKYVKSWSTLAATVLCIIWVLFMCANMEDFLDLIWIVLGVYLTGKGLMVSFSQKAYERDCAQQAQRRRAYRRVFGRWEPIVIGGISLLLLLTVLLAVLAPQHIWLFWLMLFVNVALAIWLNRKMYREFEKQKQLEEEHPELINAEEQGKKAHHRTWLILIVCFCLLGAQIWQSSGVYPPVAQPSEIEEAQPEDLQLAVDEPHYSLRKGCILRWSIGKHPGSTYKIKMQESGSAVLLEQMVDGQWMQLARDRSSFEKADESPIVLDAQTTRMDGTFSQKDAGYGTRLKAGCYRLVVCAEDESGSERMLTGVFVVD